MPVRILIVDDDKHACRILKTLLQKDPPLARVGVQVVIANDGEKGLLALEEGPFDLVISDLLMPRMDGFAFCRELRRRPPYERVPLIVSSAVYKDPITLRKLKVEVGAEFFTKPFQVAEMMAAVRRLLGIYAPASSSARDQRSEVPQAGTSGSLAEYPLPRLLLDLFESRTSCCLQVGRDEVRWRIHLLMGHIIAVDSNTRAGTLGELLCEKGLLMEEQLCEALVAALEWRKRLGQVLVERGWLTEPQLLREMEAQMRRRLASLLRMHNATWKMMSAGPAHQRIALQGGTPMLIFASLHDTAPADPGGGMQGLSPGVRLRPTARAQRMREPFEQVFGPGTLSILDRNPLLQDLQKDLNESGTRAMHVRIDAMLLSGLCTTRHESTQSAERKGVSRLPAKGLVQPGESPTGEGAIEVQVDAPSSRAEGTTAALDERHRDLLAEYLSVDGRNFYDLLGLTRDADLPAIQAAYQAGLLRLSPERFSDLDLGRDYGKISELRERYRHALGTLSSPVRRAAYDRDLDAAQTDEMSPRMIRAEVCYLRGEALLGRGELREALVLLHEAAEQAPDQADYQALLGWGHYLARLHDKETPLKSAEVARPHLLRALLIDGDHVPAHAALGHISVALLQDDPAQHHLMRVLVAQPGRRDALAGLERVFQRTEQWQQLAQLYQKQIQGLGSPFGQPGQITLAELWGKLADLSEHRLLDLTAARQARLAQCRIAPLDPVPREHLARLSAADGFSAGSGPPLDAAYLRAAVLVRRGQADPEAHELYRRHRPSFLSRGQGPISAAQLVRLRHPADNPHLDRLIEWVCTVAEVIEPLVPIPLMEADRVSLADAPSDFGRVALYIGQVLRFTWPVWYCAGARTGESVVRVSGSGWRDGLQMVAGPQGAVLVGPDLLGSKERAALAFVLGRLASLLRPGCARFLCLPADRIRTLLLGLAMAARPGTRCPDPDGSVAAVRQQLLVRELQMIQDIGDLIDETLPQVLFTDCLSWQRGLLRTADRLGLLLCNDVETAAALCALRKGQDPDAEDALLHFVLSDDYLAIRTELGLGIRE